MQVFPRTIKIEDIGPIQSLEIALPPEGGVVVLRGRNGSGKSTALSAISSLTSGKRDRITASRSTGRGSVSGLGASLTVGKRVSSTGSFGAVALTGADPSAFVDPGIKDPDAADRARLEALCRIAGIEFDPAELAAVLPNCGEIALEISRMTLADAGRRVRREVKRYAREASVIEDMARTDLVAAEKVLDAIPGAKAETTDDDQRDQVIRDSIKDLQWRTVTTAETLRVAREGAAESVAAASELEALVASGDLASQALETRANLESKTRALSVLDDERAQLLEDLRAKESEASLAVAELKTLAHRLDTLERTAKHAETLRGVVERGGGEKIQELEARLETFARDVALWEGELATLAQAKEKAAASIEVHRLRDDVEMLAERAEAWEPAVAYVDEMILRLIRERMPTDRLALDGGRLRARDQSGAVVDLVDLSAGERWRIAIDLCVSCLEPGAIVVIEQEAWEGLDPGNRQEIAAYARGAGVTVVTAECSDATTIEPLVLGGAS